MDTSLIWLLLGAALAALGGAWTAALLWIAAALRERPPRPRGESGPPPGDEAPSREELLRSAAMQEGFDNLMRYTAAAARGQDAPREEL